MKSIKARIVWLEVFYIRFARTFGRATIIIDDIKWGRVAFYSLAWLGLSTGDRLRVLVRRYRWWWWWRFGCRRQTAISNTLLHDDDADGRRQMIFSVAVIFALKLPLRKYPF